ncbi:MAG: histidine kinase [Rhodospirillales bacterium]|nr:histidine kinase [Rhodospirillales bacterium]
MIADFSSRPMTARGGAEPMRHVGRVSLRTLVFVRWVVIIGQLVTVSVVALGFQFPMQLSAVLTIIALAVAVNLLGMVMRRGRALSDRAVAVYLAFDILQLSALLFLTGGLTNPFAVLVLGPIAVAAAVLGRDYSFGLTFLAIICLAALFASPFDLPWNGGGSPRLPDLYQLGLWISLTLACGFISTYNWSVAGEARRISEALAETQLTLAREQQLTALGTLAAAAAHELGTPLSTITVVAKELARDMPADSPFAEDVALIQSQCERCRSILAELARKPEDAEESPFNRLPLEQLVEAAATPHRMPGIRLEISTVAAPGTEPPILRRTPEIMHGLGNILQNAMQFATTAVTVMAQTDAHRIAMTISDDGPGFSPGLLGRLGEPYLSIRDQEHEHLGLGIFIAQTLLERTGAELTFVNGLEGTLQGAAVMIVWPRAALAL